MKYSYIFLLPGLIACSEMNKPSHLPSVTASAETEAVSANTDDDAADDPAVWYNERQPEKSLIIGTDKKKGIDVYGLDGKLITSYEVGRINNVDVRNDVRFADTTLHIAGGSNRSTISMDFWSIDPITREFTDIGSIPSEMPDVYGFSFYKNLQTNAVYAIVNSKTGETELWELSFNGARISGKRVQTYQLQSQVEGMAVDDARDVLYIGVEEGGIYRFEGLPDGPAEGKLLTGSTSENTNIQYDIEGLALYITDDENGYLLASSQGNNSYAVFDRNGNNAYLGSFIIEDGTYDGAEETDGIEAIHVSLGEHFPNGVFICQDGYNFDGETKVAQNFKIVDWRELQKVIDGF